MTSQKLKLEISRELNASPEAVFNAVKSGVLFLQCGAKSDSMKIDFKEGGDYFLSFGPDGEVSGKFTKIELNRLVAFTWGNGTKVLIVLEPTSTGTVLQLAHSEIPDKEWFDAYRGGWEDGLNGLRSKM